MRLISIKIRWLKEIMKCSAITKVCENQSAKEKKYYEFSMTFGIRFAGYAETHHTLVIHLMNTITSNVEVIH